MSNPVVDSTGDAYDQPKPIGPGTRDPQQLELFTELAQEPIENRVIVVQETAFQLWLDRQRKYGSTNISRTGAMGCYVRATDKLARLSRVYRDGAQDMPDESISDSWLDLMNYAMMGYMCHNGLWPKEGE